MIADSIARLDGIAAAQDVWVITARDLLEAVRAAVPSIQREHLVGEPMGKNTAPAVALAAWWLRKAGPDSVVAILPSDHRIEPAVRFREELSAAAAAALERKAIVTLGIPPTRPDTGYGYIQVGKAVTPGSPLHEVSAFREKPDAATAAKYVADKKHLWNAGMFLFRPDVMLEEIRAHAPDLAAQVAAVPDPSDPGVDAALDRYYAAANSISIDYAVMERTRHALVARASFEWDDLGSWATLARPGSEDENGNVARGDVLLHDSTGVIAFSDGGLVAGVGLRDLIIVRTGDVTLVCPRDRAQDVRALVDRLKKKSDGNAPL
jgi:mannose-1-phosphate guanylyltransferase